LIKTITVMKKYLLAAVSMFAITGLQAQSSQGKVTYDRISKLQINFAGLPGGMEQQMPSSRTDKFELIYGNNQSLWKQAENETEDDGGSFQSENGANIRMIVAGSNDVLYSNLETGKKVESREMMDKVFIVEDSISKLKWKMAGETKVILGHNCMKATASRLSKRTMMNMDNGVMEKKEIEDTSLIVAWFATDIPVSTGPGEFQGQLPGLILEMDIKEGTQVFKATSISEKADLAIIKEPSGKKRYTKAQFKEEVDKMLNEMNQGGGGNRRVIRMN
jgi:GLPGLI family protein